MWVLRVEDFEAEVEGNRIFCWISPHQAIVSSVQFGRKPVLEALVGNELAMQLRINLSIQLPQDNSFLLPVHADVWSGDSPYEVVVWLPLVDCYRTKAMYLLPPEADQQLREEGVNRLGNVLVPDDSYGIPIENWMQPILEELYSKDKRWIPWKIWHELGLRLANESKGSESLLAACAKKNIKVFVPGPTDGAVGSQLWLFWQSHKDFTLDILAEELRLSHMAISSILGQNPTEDLLTEIFTSFCIGK